MPTLRFVFRNTHGRYHPTYTGALSFYRSVGVLQSKLHLAVSEDNEACLAWLEGALDYAYVQHKPELWAYLEAVMEEVLFEIEHGPCLSL